MAALILLALLVCFLLDDQVSGVTPTLLRASPAPGYIVSKDWPKSYPHNHRALWTMTSLDENYVVTAQAISVHIEPDSGCRWDFVQVHDGPNVSSPSLGRFCGFSRPWFTSTTQNLTVSFITDSSRSFSGFKIKYWCALKKGVVLKSASSEKDNIIAVILASAMFVTLTYVVIIGCCRNTLRRFPLQSNIPFDEKRGNIIVKAPNASTEKLILTEFDN